MSAQVEAIRQRALRLRLTKKVLAERAQLDETTVGRTLNGTTVPLVSTLAQIETAIAQEEADLFAYLHTLLEHAA